MTYKKKKVCSRKKISSTCQETADCSGGAKSYRNIWGCDKSGSPSDVSCPSTRQLSINTTLLISCLTPADYTCTSGIHETDIWIGSGERVQTAATLLQQPSSTLCQRNHVLLQSELRFLEGKIYIKWIVCLITARQIHEVHLFYVDAQQQTISCLLSRDVKH